MPETLPPRRTIERALQAQPQGLRILARDLDAGSSRIDWVSLDDDGTLVGSWLCGGEAGAEAAALARALAARRPLLQRAAEWRQLLGDDRAPDPRRPPRLQLLAARFSTLTLAAAKEVGIELLLLRSLEAPQPVTLLIEDWQPSDTTLRPPQSQERPSPEGETSRVTPQPSPRTDPTSEHPESPKNRTVFRSGLTDIELGLNPEERSEFS